MTSDDPRADLERLVLDNAELERLEAIIDTFNPFVAMRWTRQEVRHSTFLAWLLNPRETHGLGAYCLKTFLKRIAHYSKGSINAPSVIDVDSWDLEGATISAEWRGIDILVQDDTNGFVAVFENKIDSGEHSNQLGRYRKIIEAEFPAHRKLLSFLTIEGDAPTDQGYIPIGYSEVASFIEDTLQRRGEQVGPEVRSFLSQYAEMVRRHIVEDSEIHQLCRSIYAKHQKALDLIFEHKPDVLAGISEVLQEIVKRHGLVLDHSTKSYVRFLPVSWDAIPKVGSGWTPSLRMLLFEFDLSKGGVFLKLVLGPGEQGVRDRLQTTLASRADILNKAGTRPYPKWWSSHIEKWMSAKQIEESEPSEIETLLANRVDGFVKNQLPAMEHALGQAIWPASTKG